MKKIVLITMLFKIANSFDPVVINSIPKCGTHLTSTIIELLTNYRPATDSYKGALNWVRNKKYNIIVSHIPYTNEYFKLITEKEYKIIFVYRDPRDFLVSLAHWIDIEPQEWGAAHRFKSIEQRIDFLINGNFFPKDNFFPYKLNGEKGVSTFFKNYIPWKKKPNVLAVKFEELIGSNGGESDEILIKTLEKICLFLNIEIDSDKVRDISKQIWGNPINGNPKIFRKGKTQEWKKVFTDNNTKNFNRSAKWLLEELEYKD